MRSHKEGKNMKLKKTSTGMLTALLLIVSSLSFAEAMSPNKDNGLITLKSKHDVSETINRLEAVLNKKGMTIFKRIDHSAGAEKAGIKLRPTELLIFGNPKVGTPLMLCSQTAGIDLPQKALAYEDEKGQTWLSYNDPAYMAKRHNIRDCDAAVQKVSNALAKFASIATK